MKKTFTYLQGLSQTQKREIFRVSPYVLDLTLIQKQSALQPRNLLNQVTALGIALCLSASTLGLTYGKINGTVSYFRDTDVSTRNIFQAGLLGFRVDSQGTGYTFDGPSDADGGFHTALIIPDSGSLPMVYKISVEKTSGSDIFCAALHATATTSPFLYDDALLGFATTTTSPGPLELGITLADATYVIDGDICNVDMVYEGWSDASTTPFGYTDTRRVPLQFSYITPEVKRAAAPALIDVPVLETPPNDATTTPPIVPETVPTDTPSTDAPLVVDPPVVDPVIPDPLPLEPTIVDPVVPPIE